MPKALDALVKASSISLRHSLDGISGVAHLFQSRIWGAYGTRLIVDFDKYECSLPGVLTLDTSLCHCLGSPSLSSLHSQLQLQYYPTETDMNDAAYSYSKTASDVSIPQLLHVTSR